MCKVQYTWISEKGSGSSGQDGPDQLYNAYGNCHNYIWNFQAIWTMGTLPAILPGTCGLDISVGNESDLAKIFQIWPAGMVVEVAYLRKAPRFSPDPVDHSPHFLRITLTVLIDDPINV